MNESPASIVVVSCGLALIAFTGAEAQVPTHGSRLRVQLDTAQARGLVGTFQGMRDSTLLLAGSSGVQPIPVGRISRLDLSEGSRPSPLGGVVGLVAGAAAGFALGCLANPDDYGVYCGGQDDSKVVLGVVLGGLAGASLGAILFRREHWKPLALPLPELR